MSLLPVHPDPANHASPQSHHIGAEKAQNSPDPAQDFSMDTSLISAEKKGAPEAKTVKPMKRKLKNDLAALGPVPKEDLEGRPKRAPRLAARKAQESVAALPENSPNGHSPGNNELLAKPFTLQSSPVITGKMPSLKYEEGTFVEPELATPKPGYSGHTLESFPPAKMKRAAVTVPKGKRGRKSNVAVKPDDGMSLEREKQYHLHLQTAKSETLCQPSELREKLPKSAKATRATQVISIPATPSSTFHISPGRSIKRLKITSPKRPPALMARTVPEEAESPDDNNNDDYCFTCGGTGVFICCDTCPKSFHLLCCNPPLQEIPEENWNCTECLAKHGLITKRSFKAYGMFGGLLDTVHGRNPTEFRLPKNLRDSTFVGVHTGDDLEYADGSMKPDVPVPKTQLSGFNKNEELDVDALYDTRGNPWLCHKCKMSGMQRRTMVSCDFCPLWWHLDCLPGVVCSAKTLGQKWRCPNHIESIVPAHWLERRSFKDALVLDASVHNNFLSYVQASNFLIKYKDEPYLDGSPSLQEYQQRISYQYEADFERKHGTYSQVESEDDDDVDADFKVPEHMQNFAGARKISAKGSTKLTRILLATSGKGEPYIYRVPEQSVVLDFLNKGGIKKNIEYYEEHKKRAQAQDLDAVSVLLSMGKEKQEKEKEESTLQTAEVETEKEEKISKTAEMQTEDVKAANGEAVQENQTLDELEHIRRLIRLKGLDKLMEFLQS